MNEKETIKKCLNNAFLNGYLSLQDFDWLEDVLNRRSDSHDYILELALKFEKLNKKNNLKLSNIDDNIVKLKLYKINKEIEKLKVFFFKQRKILIAIPQRKKHPKFPAPNLGGLTIPQNYRIKGEVCYGMPHAEARNWLVENALEDNEITDILFVDDDILLPNNAISILADSHEMIVGANYVKKQLPVETCALHVINKNGMTHNQEIHAEQNNLQLTNVSQMGMGACLINIDVFKKIKKPWFEFIYNKDGSIYAGEDVRFFQKAIIEGFTPKIIPGLVPIHVDFRTGKHYGPDWLVNNGYIKKEFIDHYYYFECDPKECFYENIK